MKITSLPVTPKACALALLLTVPVSVAQADTFTTIANPANGTIYDFGTETFDQPFVVGSVGDTSPADDIVLTELGAYVDASQITGGATNIARTVSLVLYTDASNGSTTDSAAQSASSAGTVLGTVTIPKGTPVDLVGATGTGFAYASAATGTIPALDLVLQSGNTYGVYDSSTADNYIIFSGSYNLTSYGPGVDVPGNGRAGTSGADAIPLTGTAAETVSANFEYTVGDVPEPSSLALIGAGLLSLVLLGRFRRRNS